VLLFIGELQVNIKSIASVAHLQSTDIRIPNIGLALWTGHVDLGLNMKNMHGFYAGFSCVSLP